MLVRRVHRFCSNIDCGELLRIKENETLQNFQKRNTCNTTCSGAYRKQKTQEESQKCFCGRPQDNGSPYCCYDHRLIAIKCKQWRIPLTLSDYLAYSRRLEEQQRINDRYY
jgi:hypothetical protein